MAGITLSGLGSGLDIAGIIDKLVAAERAPESQRIARAQSDSKLKLSAMAMVSSAFSGLQATAAVMRDSATYGARKATSANESVFMATAASAAQMGSYDVEVVALASAHKLLSAGMNPDTGLGAGTLHVTLGAIAFDVVVEAGADTPSGIRDAFNLAAQAAGAKVSAGLIHGDSGASLVFAAAEGGAANAIRMTRTGSAGLDALVYDPGTLTALTERTAAQDAQVRVDGLLRSAAGNTITNVIPGVTLDLKSAVPGTVTVLTVAADNTATVKSAENLVAAWNTVIDAVGRATAYGGSAGTSGALIGDSMVRSFENRLRSTVGAVIGELVGVGIDTRTDGKLAFNAGKLSTALAGDTVAVAGKLQGFGDALKGLVDGYVGTSGLLGSRTASLNQKLRDLDRQTNSLNSRMDDVRLRYTRQFTALDTLVGQMNTTSQYLSQQLAMFK